MIFAQIFYGIAILGGLYGCWVVFESVNGVSVDNVMQQVARVTFAMSYAILPYVIARSIERLARGGDTSPGNTVVYGSTNNEMLDRKRGSRVEEFNESSRGEWRTNRLTGQKLERVAKEDIKGKWGD